MRSRKRIYCREVKRRCTREKRRETCEKNGFSRGNTAQQRHRSKIEQKVLAMKISTSIAQMCRKNKRQIVKFRTCLPWLFCSFLSAHAVHINNVRCATSLGVAVFCRHAENHLGLAVCCRHTISSRSLRQVPPHANTALRRVRCQFPWCGKVTHPEKVLESRIAQWAGGPECARGHKNMKRTQST